MRRVLGALGVLLVVVSPAIGPGIDAGAQTLDAFTLTARADSVGMQLITKDAPVVSIGGGEVVLLTPSSAQATLDSLGSSRGFASAPYPGDLVVGLPNTVNGAAGGRGAPTLPNYPFYVASVDPTTPSANHEVGPYGLNATSTKDASTGSARVGLNTSFDPRLVSITANASVRRAVGDKLTATAATTLEPFALADVLRVGEIRSTATATFDPSSSGGVRKSASLDLGVITVAGVKVAVTKRGLALPGQEVPVGTSELTNQLAAAGITIEYVPGSETATSITSAGLRISYTADFPSLGQTTVRLLLGQVSATAAPQPAPLVGAIPAVVSQPGGVDAALPAPPAAASPPAVAGLAVTPRAAVLPAPRSGRGILAVAIPTAPRTSRELLWLYPVLAIGAGLALGSSRFPVWRGLRRLSTSEADT